MRRGVHPTRLILGSSLRWLDGLYLIELERLERGIREGGGEGIEGLRGRDAGGVGRRRRAPGLGWQPCRLLGKPLALSSASLWVLP